VLGGELRLTVQLLSEQCVEYSESLRHTWPYTLTTMNDNLVIKTANLEVLQRLLPPRGPSPSRETATR